MQVQDQLKIKPDTEITQNRCYVQFIKLVFINTFYIILFILFFPILILLDVMGMDIFSDD